MSNLKLYAPQENDVLDFSDDFDLRIASEETDPAILSFGTIMERVRGTSFMELVTRSRVIYRNKECRCCGRPTVEPVEQEDALQGRNRMPTPGAGTLVGFQCQYCRHHWRF